MGLDVIEGIVGAENVVTDERELEFLSQDYFKTARSATAAIRPESTETLAKAVAAATQAGMAIYQRGGGYSYTDAYLPTQWPCLIIDMRSMDKVLEVNREDMFVRVQAGCTWAKLYDVLAEHGLRTPCMGPESGLRATVGGGVSQGAAGHGTGRFGLTTESVLGMEVVLADGSVLVTGSAGQDHHSAFFRHYGPDLTGLFCQDAGALGVKATVTLRVQASHPVLSGVSYACDDFESAAAAMAGVARTGVAYENFGVPSALIAEAVNARTLSENLATLRAVAGSGAGYLDSLTKAVRLVAGGKAIGRGKQETVHFGLEAPNRKTMGGYIRAIRRSVGSLGVEIPNSVPVARRADPFPDHPLMTPLGHRQLPFHAILPFSQAAPFHRALGSAIDARGDDMARCRLRAIAVYAAIGSSGLLYEPVLQWEDVPSDFHRQATPDAILEKAEANEPNADARALAEALSDEWIQLMYEHGGVHLQIGKKYPYLQGRDDRQLALLRDLKHRLDPEGLMNPGALGLATQN